MNERSPHAIWKAKGAAKLPPGIDLQSGRNDLNPKRRGLTVGLPIAFRSVVIYRRRKRLGEPFKPVNLCRSQTLAVIVPPVEPSPKDLFVGTAKGIQRFDWVGILKRPGSSRPLGWRKQMVCSPLPKCSADGRVSSLFLVRNLGDSGRDMVEEPAPLVKIDDEDRVGPSRTGDYGIVDPRQERLPVTDVRVWVVIRPVT